MLKYLHPPEGVPVMRQWPDFMEDTFDVSQLSGEAALIFDQVVTQNYAGASIFWICRLAVLDIGVTIK